MTTVIEVIPASDTDQQLSELQSRLRVQREQRAILSDIRKELKQRAEQAESELSELRGQLERVTKQRDDHRAVTEANGDALSKFAGWLARIAAIIDEPLDERQDHGPTRQQQFARIEEVMREVKR